ncbi:MAG: DUF3365 domain-containing protein [Moraxellaceae bacterium]|nr:DUF3365 domain-containing protein [Moraxellaceae bacterium]MDP1776784.1 DUF3365 domain-containing protein [Moraxellaceae bacterium]
MSHRTRPVVVLSSLLLLSASVIASPLNTLDEEANRLSSAFAGELMSALMQAVSKGGHPLGVTTCQVIAPAIAAKYSQDGWHVGRTSLQVRNANNMPDDWERDVLLQFAEARKQLPDQVPTSVSTLTDDGYRYMRPIVLAQPCLACHGQAINEPTQTAISTAYPADKATGYQVGDIRGAFTLSKVMGAN